MKVVRADSGQASRGTTFTGPTTLRRLLGAQTEGGLSLSVVTFEDGARTNWHVHPGEQVLYVLSGLGRAGTADERFELRPGDVVHIGPGERHWHGAAEGQSMAHISVTNVGPPTWFEAPD